MTFPSSNLNFPASSKGFGTDVLIVGAGPTGLTLAASLLARGVRTCVIDRQAEGANTSRAAVVHARTLEVLEPLGVTQRLVARGIQARQFTIRDRDRVLVPIGFSQLPTQYPYTLMVSQAVTESVLLQRLVELGGRVLRPRTLAALVQDASGATATLDDGSRMRARFVVGADGMHSAVRESAGIAFNGGSYGESFVLADVRLDGGVPIDEVILYFSPAGMVVLAPLPDGVHRVVATVSDAPEQPDAAYVQGLLDARGPQRERALVQEVVWGSRFRVHHRVAESYRAGRILLAGDAAHDAAGPGRKTKTFPAVLGAADLRFLPAGRAREHGRGQNQDAGEVQHGAGGGGRAFPGLERRRLRPLLPHHGCHQRQINAGIQVPLRLWSGCWRPRFYSRNCWG